MKKKFTQSKWLVTMILLVTAMAMPKMAWAEIRPTKPSIGDGTSANPYQIGTAAELYWFAGLVNGTLTDGTSKKTNANAVLTKDITVNTKVLDSDGNPNNGSGFETWTPIGKDPKTYAGTFDGQGHTISGLYFNDGNASYVGLFGGNSGTIKNVGVVDSYFYGKFYVGGVCGYNTEGKITGCYNSGTVSGSQFSQNVGGVCGYNRNTEGKITGCYNTGTVSGSQYSQNVGGVCGQNTLSSKITGCYSTGSVSGSISVGGVCGGNVNSGKITGCYYDNVKCTIKGINGSDILGQAEGKSTTQFQSGEVCTLLNGALKDAKASVRFYQGVSYPELIMNVPTLDGEVYQISNKEELYVFALLVNKNVETSANAVLTADITVNTGVLKSDGTLAGNYYDFEPWTPIGNSNIPYIGTFDGQGHTISGLYFKDSDAYYVGLFGNNNGTIKNVGVVDSYFKGFNDVGGVCGYSYSSSEIINCYNTGTVSGDFTVGGVCGYNNGGKITGCYNTGSVSGTNDVGGVCGANFTAATITNCYNNSEKYKGKPIGDNNGTVTNVEGKTTAQFKSGEVAYLLSQGSTVTDGENTTYYSGASWGQQLGTDDYPVLSDYKVIKAAEGDNKTYWATFSNQSSDMDLRNLTVYTATVSKGILTLTPCTDHIVAKGEGVLVKGNSEYLNALMLNDDTEKAEANNDLVATPAKPTVINATTGHVLYRLTYNNVSAKEGLGFYLGLVKNAEGTVLSQDGSQLKATPGKAYVKVSNEAATNHATAALARGFVFPGDDEATGIGEIVIEGEAGISGSANADGRIYNLQGQQVTAPVKGLYIKNNKKVIIK